MPASYLHGVETIEIDKGPRPVQLVKTAVIGIVGTAAAGPVNTPILVSNERDFAQFGEDIAGSTILDALQHIYQQKGTVCVVVNVLDPAIHKTVVTDEVVNVAADGSFRTSRPAIAAVSIKSANGATVYTAGTDYQIDLRSGRGQRIGNPTQVEKDTWALKLEVATALADKAAISSAGQAFLQSAGLSADAAKLAWASSVLTKSAAYGQVVGLAERLRDAARRAAKAAHDEVALKAALDAQRAAADAAVAKLLKGF